MSGRNAENKRSWEPKPNCSICNAATAPKSQGAQQKRDQKDCIHQKICYEIASPRDGREATSVMLLQCDCLKMTGKKLTPTGKLTWKRGI